MQNSHPHRRFIGIRRATRVLTILSATLASSWRSLKKSYANNDVTEARQKQNCQYYGRSIGIVERVLGHPQGARAMPFQNQQNHYGFICIIEHTRWTHDFHYHGFGKISRV